MDDFISVVIPHGGSIETLSAQIGALLNQTLPPDEIVISCNDKRNFERLLGNKLVNSIQGDDAVLVDASRKRGPSFARNLGWRASRGNIVLFCDDDDEVDRFWVQRLRENLYKNHVCGGALSYELLNPGSAVQGERTASKSAPTKFRHLPYGPSSNLGVRRAVLEKLDGFDEEFLCGEDIDFCWRAQYEGFSFEFVPDAIVNYRLRSDFKKAFRQGMQYGKSDGQLLKRHATHGASHQIFISVRRIVGIFITCCLLLVNRATLADVSLKIGLSLGRIISSLTYRVWVF